MCQHRLQTINCSLFNVLDFSNPLPTFSSINTAHSMAQKKAVSPYKRRIQRAVSAVLTGQTYRSSSVEFKNPQVHSFQKFTIATETTQWRGQEKTWTSCSYRDERKSCRRRQGLWEGVRFRNCSNQIMALFLLTNHDTTDLESCFCHVASLDVCLMMAYSI